MSVLQQRQRKLTQQRLGGRAGGSRMLRKISGGVHGYLAENNEVLGDLATDGEVGCCLDLWGVYLCLASRSS